MVTEHLTNEFLLSLHEFKQILASTFEEEVTDFFSFKSNQLEEMQKFLRLSTQANSLTQANVDLERFFRIYLTECFEAYHELTGDIEFHKISKDDLIHLAARKIIAQRLVHVMPETKLLIYKQVVRHIMALTEGLNKSYKIKIIAGKEFDNSIYPEGDALISYYAENFADLVREQRVKPFHTQIDVAGSLILIREDPAESERVNPLPNATPFSYILKDVAGMDEVKQIFQMLLLGLQEPEKIVALDVHPLHDLLLYGPPGSGKTYIVKAFANEAGIPFFYKSAAEINGQLYAGAGATMLRDFLRKAAHNAPRVVFLDEIESFSNREINREGQVAYDARSILDTLLIWMDGLEINRNIIFIGATNRLEDLDEALIHHGRFGIQIEVKHLLPSQRLGLIRLLLKPHQVDGNYEQLVERINSSLPDNYPNAAVKALIEHMNSKAITNNRLTVDFTVAEAGILPQHGIACTHPGFAQKKRKRHLEQYGSNKCEPVHNKLFIAMKRGCKLMDMMECDEIFARMGNVRTGSASAPLKP